VPGPLPAQIIALTRDVSSAIDRCELTHLARRPIDLGRAREQHRSYEQCLRELRCTVQRLAEEAEMPDSVFVEDIAVVLDEVAIITRPGAASRRGERSSVAKALERFRPLSRIRAPATLDGGDVLRLGKTLYVGRSSRSNEAGRRQLRTAVEDYGYSVRSVSFDGCLHLKSAVTAVGEGTVLVNPAWVEAAAFAGTDTVEVDPGEPAAANALLIGGKVLFPSQHPMTAERLGRGGIKLKLVDVSELTKAEAGVTCCSLVFDR